MRLEGPGALFCRAVCSFGDGRVNLDAEGALVDMSERRFAVAS